MHARDKRLFFLLLCSFSSRFDTPRAVEVQGHDCPWLCPCEVSCDCRRRMTVRDSTDIILRLGEHITAEKTLRNGIYTPCTVNRTIGSAGRDACFSSYSRHPTIQPCYQSALPNILRWFFPCWMSASDFFEGKIQANGLGQAQDAEEAVSHHAKSFWWPFSWMTWACPWFGAGFEIWQESQLLCQAFAMGLPIASHLRKPLCSHHLTMAWCLFVLQPH